MKSLFDAAHSYLQQHLTPPRYAHSVGVMHIMADLALIYAFDLKQAQLAGLLHDIAKDTPIHDMLALARKANISLGDTIMHHPMYLHGPVGAYLVRRIFAIDDAAVLTAIRTHTTHDTPPASAHRLCWCLRFADILAPVKPWLGQNKLHHFVYAGHFEQAQLLFSRWVIEYFEQVHIPVHPNFTRNEATFAEQLQVSEDFYRREL